MKKIVLLFILYCSIIASNAQEFKVNINKLTEETQQVSESPDKMQLIWWIPTDFWKAVFDQDNNIPKDQASTMLSHLEKYTMIVAVDGDIDVNGDITYHSEQDIFNKLKISDDKNESFKPLLYDEIDLDTQQLINIMKPMLGQMLGKVGENMHFFMFQKREDPLYKIVDPVHSKTFEVMVDNEKFKWNLPLSSLLKPKRCSVDNKHLDGAFMYCPYHGTKLISN